jgi:NAD(P)-dependent dehydrogenase (short-subunit alcohol dehydrogenase family)
LRKIKGRGGKAIPHQADVTNQSDIKSLFESIGGIDILVNCAGISNIGKADKYLGRGF